MSGIPFVISMIYLTFLTAFVVTLLERGYDGRTLGKTLHRWGKFLLLLGILAIVIQVLTVIHGRVT